jgi:hypothetical protein
LPADLRALGGEATLVTIADLHGYVPRSEVLPRLIELISRCGTPYKVEKYHGISRSTVGWITRGKCDVVRRKTAWRIEVALAEQRERGPTLQHIPQVLVLGAQELLQRCGSALKVEKAHGIPDSTILLVASGKTSSVRPRTAERILSALILQRRHDRKHGVSKRYLRTLQHAAVREGQLRRDYGI